MLCSILPRFTGYSIIYLACTRSSILQVLVICHELITSDHGLLRDCIATSLQLIRLIKCGIDLEYKVFSCSFQQFKRNSNPCLTGSVPFSCHGLQPFLLISLSCKSSYCLHVYFKATLFTYNKYISCISFLL